MKKISRRSFLQCAACTAVATGTTCLLSACGGASSSVAANAASSAASGAATAASGSINFYYWDDAQTDAVNALIELFKTKNSNIEVVATQIPSGEYWTKLQTALPTGTGPDVFWMNRNIPDYISADLVADLTDRIAADGVDMTVFPQFLQDLYSRDGATYAIPKDYDGIGLFYNKAIFDEMKVDYPTDDMSWEDLLSLAKQTTTQDHYGFAAQNAGNVCYQDFIYSNKGRISSADNIGCEINEAPAVEAIQYLHDMMYKDKVSPSYAEQQEMKVNDMFVAGQLAMITAGSWKLKGFVDALGDDLGICTMPVSKVQAITVHGVGYCIASQSKNMDASWEFVKFCATEEAQAATVSGAIPAYKGCDDLWAKTYEKYSAEKLLAGAYYENSLGNPWWDNHFTDANAILTDAVTTIWSDESADIQAALDKCAGDIEAITKA